VKVKWVRVDPGPVMKASFPGTRAWQRDVADGHLMVLAGLSPTRRTHGRCGTCPSATAPVPHPPRPGRYPDWDEITEARYRFIPDEIRVAMLLPPRAEYLSLHDTCFHLWELEGTR